MRAASTVLAPQEVEQVSVTDIYTPSNLGKNHLVSTEVFHDPVHLCNYLTVRYKFDSSLTSGMFGNKELKFDMIEQVAEDAAKKIKKAVMDRLLSRNKALGFS